MVVMEKKESTVFDTRDDPDPANRYVTEIDFAQRLTWGGEYIHAAPWSEDVQGRQNVSHGCVNVSHGERPVAVRQDAGSVTRSRSRAPSASWPPATAGPRGA